MGKNLTALALAALLVLGLSGCSSGNNVTTDRSYGTRSTYGTDDTYGTYDNGTNGYGYNDSGRSRGVTGDIGNGIDNAMDGLNDTLTGDSRRYQEMLENGRVHDTDGYLLDGENRFD